jgi:Amt family ammonium transporter
MPWPETTHPNPSGRTPRAGPAREAPPRRGIPRRLLAAAAFLLTPGSLAAQEAPQAALAVGVDTLWVLLAAFLVFLMQAGFGMVEAGFIRAKNVCNILTKNFLDYCMASLGYFIFGYAIMFGAGNALFGTEGFMLSGAKSPAPVPLYAFWLFQTAFCGAAATIVAGGMAERMRFPAYLMYSFVISAFIYPVVGHWVWGGGWLAQLGFSDFAGSTVVHAVGGWAAFTGTAILGPRIGKYNADGSPNSIAGHSIPLASLGVFLLWFGWFGFNPGSTLSVGDGQLIGLIAVNTNLAASAGALLATVAAWWKFGKPDLSLTMNGALAGLVSITAPCAWVSPGAAIYIGALGGIIVVFGVLALDRVRIDDPVGAVPVHAMCGVWGTLAVGLFGQSALGLAQDGLFYGGGFGLLGIQALGTFTVSLFIILSMGLVFKTIDAVVGLRVSQAEELRGLDIGEHGMESYSGFQIFTTE